MADVFKVHIDGVVAEIEEDKFIKIISKNCMSDKVFEWYGLLSKYNGINLYRKNKNRSRFKDGRMWKTMTYDRPISRDILTNKIYRTSTTTYELVGGIG